MPGNFAELNRDWLGWYTRYGRQIWLRISYRIAPLSRALIADPAFDPSPVWRLKLASVDAEGFVRREGHLRDAKPLR